jgi:hypothetical protein
MSGGMVLAVADLPADRYLVQQIILGKHVADIGINLPD